MEASQEALRALEAEASALIAQYASTPLADKARSQKLGAAIQAKLAAIRAAERDLELMVEELDRRGADLMRVWTEVPPAAVLPGVSLAPQRLQGSCCWCCMQV